MLSVLEIENPGKPRDLRELWRRLTTPSVSAWLRPAGNAHYMKICCEIRRKGIDWRMINAYSLDVSERMLLPSGIEPPADCGIRRYIPFAFRRRMLENLAVQILVCSEKQPELRRVAVYGHDPEVISLLPRLTALAGEIRVITRRVHAFSDTAQELYAKTGTPISVTEVFDAEGFDMLLSTAGGAGMFRLSESTVVLSPDRPSAACSLWIEKARPTMPTVLEDIYDERYDLEEFIGAFCEIAEICKPQQIPPTAGYSERGEVSAQEAAAFIGRRAVC